MNRTTRDDDFARTVSAWLHGDAEQRMPDTLDAVLARTRTERQRPAWSSLERWLPVQTTLRLAPVPRIAWVLVVLALVAALGVAALAIGSRQHQLPPPFGLARNGTIVYAGTDNDLYALDPVTGASRALVTGAAGDRRPVLSPDGTRLLFLRDTTTVDPLTFHPEPMVMVANVDGSGVRALSGALASFDGFGNVGWSHDGSKVVVSSSADPTRALQVFATDGAADPVIVDTKGMTALYVSFRPGDRELTFRGSASTGSGLYAVGTDGKGLRTILAVPEGDGASLSSDGTKIAYQVWDGRLGTIHVVDVDTGRDSVPAMSPPSTDSLVDGEPAWSPDGTRFLFVRYTIGADNHLVVASAAGGPRTQIGPAMPNCSCHVSAQFSPDGTKVVVHFDYDRSTWMLDPTGSSPGTKLPSTIGDEVTWQRLAL